MEIKMYEFVCARLKIKVFIELFLKEIDFLNFLNVENNN